MALRVLLLVTAALAVLAAGCGGSRNRSAQPRTTPTHAVASCKLDRTQRRAVALSLRDIRRLRQIQAPLHRFSDAGTSAQEAETGKFLADLTSVKLPVNVRAHLLHVAKSAVGLCGNCFQGLEAEEPVLATRLGEKRCG